MKRWSPLAARLLACLIVAQIIGQFAGQIAHAQGFLVVENQRARLPRPIIIHRRRPVPLPPVSYAIKELAIQARITDQVARVQVSQSFVNTGSRQMEVSFIFPLPYDGAVDQLTLMVDGKELEGKLMPAKEARKVYEGYLRRNQDPALLEWIGTGMFKTRVFPVPPGAERKVMLKFSQLLRKDHQLTDFLFPLSTAKYTSHPVERFSIQATIESNQEIKSVYSPTHSIDIKRPDAHHASVSLEVKNQIPTADFRLFYDVAPSGLGASLLSYRPSGGEDGYFLMLASPQLKADKKVKTPKTAIVVIDRSGSMSGKKMDQAKEAVRFVVNHLEAGDLFNIIAYDSTVESFKPEIQRFNDDTRKAALGFVDALYAGGSTNISGALTTALEMIKDSKRPNYVLFLTDGRPTAGETNEAKISALIRKQNKLRSRLVSFGVGYDVNSRLLDRLSRGNFGQSEYVRPNEDIEAHVSRLYNRISSPVMTNVVVNVEVDDVKVEDGDPINRVYPREVHDLFAGEQLVLVGRYRKPGDAKVVIEGQVAGKTQKLDFPAKLVTESGDQGYSFVEKLWAMRRIGEIIDELDLVGKNDELINELIALSTKHGILTPYTSFLADENNRDLARADRQKAQTVELLSRLNESAGRAAFSQRGAKKAFQEAKQLPPGGAFGGFGGGGGAGDGGAANGPGGGGRGRPARAGGRGGAQGKPRSAAPRAPAQSLGGGVRFRNIDTDEEVVTDSVQSVGKETLYKRGKLWIATSAKDIDLAKDKAKVKVVKRFSDDYFKLIAKNTKAENAVLARQQEGEELLIKLRGQVYHIQ